MAYAWALNPPPGLSALFHCRSGGKRTASFGGSTALRRIPALSSQKR